MRETARVLHPAPSTLTAAGLILGYLADQVFGDPARMHPVAGFGTVAASVQRRCWADSRLRGAQFVAAMVTGAVLVGTAGTRLTRGHPVGRVLWTAGCTWTVLGGRSLLAEAQTMQSLLEAGDLPAARHRLSHLCSRDATELDQHQLLRATLESLAENTSDAVTGPLLWGALAGAPGLLGYRAVNTLDAMVGYRTERLKRFGWAAARLDDLVNLIPARVTAALTVAAAPVVGGRPERAWAAWRRDARRHPSPNAGPVEASTAGALGISLGGRNVYQGRVERRATLGDGPAPGPDDLARAMRLQRVVMLGALGSAVLVCAARPQASRRAAQKPSGSAPSG